MLWKDQYTGEQYRISTEGFHRSRHEMRVKTYGDVLYEYHTYPGSKSAVEEVEAGTKGCLSGRVALRTESSELELACSGISVQKWEIQYCGIRWQALGFINLVAPRIVLTGLITSFANLQAT